MARIRTIKPDFCTSKDTAALSRDARLFFVQLWTECDDEGRLLWLPKRIAGALYPYDDDVTPAKVEGWAKECAKRGMVVIHETKAGTVLQVCNWQKHQKISHPLKSKLDAAPESSGKLPESSGNPPQIAEILRSEVEGEVEGEREVEIAAGKPAAPTTPVFEAYSQAYASRHGVAPARNAETNAVLKRFGEKVGWPDAPAIAAFFVSSNDAFLVRERHPLKVLAANAEKYRTEWLTGCQITGNQARQQERTADNPFARMTKQTQRAIAHEN